VKKFDELSDTTEHLSKILKKAKKLTIFEVSSEFMKDSNFYAPMDTGDLKRSAQVHSILEDGHIEWNTLYARRLFYNPQYNFSKDANPYARGLWAEVAKQDNPKKYRGIITDSFNKAKGEA